MMVTVYEALGLLLMILGMIGYSFSPPEEYVGGSNVITSLCVYYLTLGSFLVLEEACEIVRQSRVMVLELVFILLLLCVVIYGLNTLRRIWTFKVEKVREFLLYGSVVYLMDKQVYQELGKFTNMIDAILLILVIWLAIILGYTALKFRRYRVFVAFEDFQLIPIIYFTTFLVGLCLFIGKFAETLAYLLLVTLTVYALHIIVNKYLKPVMV